jgi:futalosine hydrolase
MKKKVPPGLIIAATAFEITPLLLELKKKEPVNEWGPDILITGIGLTASTYTLTRYLSIKKPSWIIQAGVGGCFDHSIPLASVFAVGSDTIADQSVVELGTLKTLFDLHLLPENQFPFKKGWLKNESSLLKKCRLKRVKGISVNEITTDRKKVRFYEEHFQPVIESMEGAALHYVCLMEKIPFLQIRSVSNYIAERNRKKWDMNASVEKLNQEVIRLLKTLQE